MLERKMASKLIESEILGTLRKCSKDEGEGGTSAGQNSGCEMSGWNVDGEEFRM